MMKVVVVMEEGGNIRGGDELKFNAHVMIFVLWDVRVCTMFL